MDPRFRVVKAVWAEINECKHLARNTVTPVNKKFPEPLGHSGNPVGTKSPQPLNLSRKPGPEPRAVPTCMEELCEFIRLCVAGHEFLGQPANMTIMRLA